jgi:hypothetical protein
MKMSRGHFLYLQTIVMLFVSIAFIINLIIREPFWAIGFIVSAGLLLYCSRQFVQASIEDEPEEENQECLKKKRTGVCYKFKRRKIPNKLKPKQKVFYFSGGQKETAIVAPWELVAKEGGGVFPGMVLLVKDCDGEHVQIPADDVRLSSTE